MVDIKKDFPFFDTHPDLVYLDNAATTQKPRYVIDKTQEYIVSSYANIHRWSYDLAAVSEELYMKSKSRVAWLLWVQTNEIIYSYNATYCINLLAQSLCFSGMLKRWQTVLLWTWDHHANIVPWQQLQKIYGFAIVYIPLQDDGYSIDREKLSIILKDRDVAVLSVGHVSNVTGTIYDIKRIHSLVPDAFFLVDGSQSVPHFSVDIQKLDCDAFIFTAHKLYAYTWLGVMYLSWKYINELEPLLSGGGAIDDVHIDGNELTQWLQKFEPGTPNLIAAVSLLYALEYIDWIGGYRNIVSHHAELIALFLAWFAQERVVHLYGNDTIEWRIWVFSFSIDWMHPHDVADAFAEQNICVRAGGHCAHPFTHSLNKEGLVRASIGLSTTIDDVRYFFTILSRIISEKSA